MQCVSIRLYIDTLLYQARPPSLDAMSSYLYSAVRTPFGRFNGALSGVRPDDLAAGVISALLDRTPRLDSVMIDEVVWGNANKGFPPGDLAAVSTTLGWRLVNPGMPKEWTVSLGEANEQLREKHAVSRERQDAFAVRSHRLAAAAWDEGFYDDLVVPLEGLYRDEGIRADSSMETLSGLKPSFRADGTITAGNASIAIGHPLGASGARVLGTLTKVLRGRGERWGVAAICIGVGQGLAVVLENTKAGR